MKKTWKQAHLHNIELRYGGRIEEYKDFTDDRLTYVKIYNQIIEAIKSLPEEPCSYIKIALWHQFDKDKEILNRIQAKFCD